jgi:hypothetical protein
MKTSNVQIVLIAMLTGCAAPQSIDTVDVAIPSGTTMCIIENPSVREGFLRTYRAALEKKGLAVDVLSPGATPADCEWVTEYDGNWAFTGVSVVLTYAKITLFQNDWISGEAIFDNRLGKDIFIDAEPVIEGMVDDLLPDN